MADFVHSSLSRVRPVRSYKGSYTIRSFQASTSVSTSQILPGQVVAFDDAASSANFRIVRCSTAAGQTPILSTNICGVSMEADTSDGSTAGLANPLNRLIAVAVADGTTDFAFPTKVVIASTLIGTGLELSWDSTLGIHHLSANSTAGDQFVRVVDILPTTTLGDTGGFLIGRFYSSAVSPIVANR